MYIFYSLGQVAALDIGYKAGVPASAKPKFVWLLGAENVPKSVTDGAFVVYQVNRHASPLAILDSFA